MKQTGVGSTDAGANTGVVARTMGRKLVAYTIQNADGSKYTRYRCHTCDQWYSNLAQHCTEDRIHALALLEKGITLSYGTHLQPKESQRIAHWSKVGDQ